MVKLEKFDHLHLVYHFQYLEAFSDNTNVLIYQEAQPKPPKISKIESFATIINNFQLLPIVAKLSISDYRGNPGCTTDKVI